jgi:DNA-directed RNA polymerase specialized sigma24 family protein
VGSKVLSAERRDVWTSLYQDSVRRVFGYLLHRCGDAVLAQDLTQETFLSVARSAHGATSPNRPWRG